MKHAWSVWPLRASLIVGLLLSSSFVSPSLAQHEQQGPSLEVIAVKFAHAARIAQVLQHTFEDEHLHVVVDDRSNRVILQAEPHLIRSAKSLIASLDLERKEAPRDTEETVIIQAQHRSARDLAKTIQPLIGGSLVVDSTRNVLLIQASAGEIEAVRKLLAVLDKSPAMLTFEFYVLGPGGASIESTPGNGHVSEELQRLGLKNYGILSRTLVRTLERAQFSVRESDTNRTMEMDGNAHLEEDGRRVSLSLQLELQRRTNDGNSQVRLETNLRLPLQDRVVVGMASAGGDDGQPLVLVSRVVADLPTPPVTGTSGGRKQR